MSPSFLYPALLVQAMAAYALAAPLLLTPLILEGKVDAAREQAKVTVNGTSYGYSGFFTVPSEHKPTELNNNIFFWYQPCFEKCDDASAPFLVWLQGGPGGPGTFGAMTEVSVCTVCTWVCTVSIV